MTTHLVRYEAARKALAEAHSIDEVKDLRDKAEAMAAYARQAKDTELIQYATEIKVRAERRCGELLQVMEKNTGARGIGTSAVASYDRTRPTLADVKVTKDESSRYQRLAAMPEEDFEAAVETAKATVGSVTSAHMLRLAAAMKENRDLEEMLAKARRELDPVSRASNEWRQVRLALMQLERELKAAESLPPLPAAPRAEILAMWATINFYFAAYVEGPRPQSPVIDKGVVHDAAD